MNGEDCPDPSPQPRPEVPRCARHSFMVWVNPPNRRLTIAFVNSICNLHVASFRRFDAPRTKNVQPLNRSHAIWSAMQCRCKRTRFLDRFLINPTGEIAASEKTLARRGHSCDGREPTLQFRLYWEP